MNNQPVKRRNPFDRPKPDLVEKHAEIQEEIKEIEQEETLESQPAYEEPVIQKPVKPAQRNSYTGTRQNKQKYIPVESQDRQKYTSTMEVTLRRKIKIICATRGIMFSEFIEEACREKLQREGER